MERIKRSVADFFELTRAYALGVTFASLVLIFAWSVFDCKFNLLNFALLSIALILVHLGANLYDDYIDVKAKLKQGLNLCDISFGSYIPKARLILNGAFSLRKVEIIVSTLFLLASIIGIYFITLHQYPVLIFMLIGGLLTLFYPISARFCLSEIVIGLIYGPLMINGGYYALYGSFNQSLMLISIAVFFTTLVLLHAHNIMDYEFDVNSKKKTVCVLLKDKEKAITFLKWLMIIAYAIVICAVYKIGLPDFPKQMLYVLFTLPVGTKLIRSLYDYIAIRDVEFNHRWYYGPFENWKNISKSNIAFYMFRLYLARNFVLLFAIFLAIGALTKGI